MIGNTEREDEILRNAARWEFLIASTVESSPENRVMLRLSDELEDSGPCADTDAMQLTKMIDAGMANLPRSRK